MFQSPSAARWLSWSSAASISTNAWPSRQISARSVGNFHLSPILHQNQMSYYHRTMNNNQGPSAPFFFIFVIIMVIIQSAVSISGGRRGTCGIQSNREDKTKRLL